MKRFVLLILAICLTGCSAGSGISQSPSVNIVDDIVEHNYSDIWSYDNNYHWHKSLDSNTIKDKEKHVFGEWNVNNDDETAVRTCEICKYKQYTYNEKEHEHAFAELYSFDEHMHWKESICGCDELIYDESEHTMIEQLVVQSNFEHKGLIKYSCSACGYSYEIYTPKQEHSYNLDEWFYDDDAHYHLCVDAGYKNLKIDYEYHIYGKWIIYNNPTESEKGLEYRICEICGYTELNEINSIPHNHTFSSELSYDDSHHWYQANCEHDVVSDYYKHDYYEDIIEHPTYDNDGKIKHTCKECGYFYTSCIPALVHSYSMNWSYDEKAHYHSCIDDGYENLSADYDEHTFDEIILENSDNSKNSIFLYCIVCGYNKIEVVTNQVG